MAAAVDQVAAQEHVARERGEAPPAPSVTDVPDVEGASAGALAAESGDADPTEDKAAEQQATTAATSAATATSPAEAADDLPAETAPVGGSLTNGDRHEPPVPDEPPVMAGALPDVPASTDGPPGSPDARAASPETAPEPVGAGSREAAAAPEKPTGEAGAEGPGEPDRPVAAPAPLPGDKRKADEPTPANGEVVDKRAKTENADGSAGTAPENAADGPQKAQRQKRQREPAPVGRTERKTRSQGPV